MYTISQAQYNQLMNFSKHAAQLNQEAQQVQDLLSSLCLSSSCNQDEDKQFIELRIKPYEREIIPDACVPLCKQWDRVTDVVYVSTMQKLLFDTLGISDPNTINKIFDILQKAGAKIAGSAALFCLQPNHGPFVPNDIDIFFSGCERGTKGYEDMQSLLHLHPGFHVSTWSHEQFNNDKDTNDELCTYKINLDIQTCCTLSFRTKRRIQLIKLKKHDNDENTSIRSFIRQFDLSCCQVFFDGIDFYIRSIYHHLTLNNFMLVCKQTNISTDKQLAERVKKYINRGFKAYTNYSNLHTAYFNGGDIPVKDALMLKTKDHTYEQDMEILLKHQPSAEVGILLVSCWNEQVRKLFVSNVSKIANHTKHYLTYALKIILQNKTLDSPTLETIFGWLFCLQDMRWLLLILSEQPQMLSFFTDDNLKRASHFARDNLQLFKNKVIENNQAQKQMQACDAMMQ